MALDQAKIVMKPWGREEWLALNDRYCYKRIIIYEGHRTSFQYHEKKHETNFFVSGEAEVWLENDNGEIEKFRVVAGQHFDVAPPKKHRIIAIRELVILEVSTPEVDDVVRIQDDAGRGDGRIESEHQK